MVAGMAVLVQRVDDTERLFSLALGGWGDLAGLVVENPLRARSLVEELWSGGFSRRSRSAEGPEAEDEFERAERLSEAIERHLQDPFASPLHGMVPPPGPRRRGASPRNRELAEKGRGRLQQRRPVVGRSGGEDGARRGPEHWGRLERAPRAALAWRRGMDAGSSPGSASALSGPLGSCPGVRQPRTRSGRRQQSGRYR